MTVLRSPLRLRVVPDRDHLLCKREIKFAKSCRSRRKALKSSKLKQKPASRFSPFCSLSIRNLRAFVATCTTFLLRWAPASRATDAPSGAVRSRLQSGSRPIHRLYSLCSVRSISAARSPMITHGAMVFPVVTRGIIDPSATRRLSTP